MDVTDSILAKLSRGTTLADMVRDLSEILVQDTSDSGHEFYGIDAASVDQIMNERRESASDEDEGLR